MRNAAIVFVTCLTFVTATQAESPAETTDSRLQTAIEAWLSDDDAGSLPDLAALARVGENTARLLLARIEATDRAPQAFVTQLSRPQRMRLFRAESSNPVFSPSWIRIEAEKGRDLIALAAIPD